jgi:hypothetical protein
MQMKNKDMPASPINEDQADQLGICITQSTGLTKHEAVSAMCLQGFLSRNIDDMDAVEIVNASICYADEFFKQLESINELY